MGYSSRNTLLTLLVLAFGLGAIVPAAWAQEECYLPITGPSQVCDGTVQLCGPGGYSAYAWTGPDGFSASTRCISVSASGTYSLRAFDPIAGLWFGPCEHVLALGASVASVAISGASSVCPGATVELCGPEPASAFEWSGPGDFTASTACVQVGTPGTYSLRVQMSADGCWSPPSEHVVAAGSCGEDPGNCPRPPWFWKWQCLSLRRVFSRDQILQVASCVNGRSQFFAWGDPLTGFGRVITRQCDLRDRAKRQFAAVWANVCACDLDLSPRCGPKIGLALSTAVHLESLDTTLGDWLAQTDATLAALEGRSLRDRAVKNGYREVIRVGWSINHGLGIGPTCQRPSGGQTATLAVTEDQEAMLEDLPLAIEMSEEPDAGLRFDRVGPNPSGGPVVVSFSVAAGASGDVSVGVYDLTGRMVCELARGPMQAGSYNVTWDGRTSAGVAVPNGMYFVMGRAGGARTERRVTLLR